MGKKRKHPTPQERPQHTAHAHGGDEADPVVRLIAVHGDMVALAVGNGFRVLHCGWAAQA